MPTTTETEVDTETLPRFKDTDFWLDIENVAIGPEIGKGHFSMVYLGKYFGDLVAVKKQIRKQVVRTNGCVYCSS